MARPKKVTMPESALTAEAESAKLLEALETGGEDALADAALEGNNEFDFDDDTPYDFTGEVTISRIGRTELKTITKITATRSELWSVSQQYFTDQKARIAAENRLRALTQGKDDPTQEGTNTFPVQRIMAERARQNEKNDLEMLQALTKNNKVCQWCQGAKGIGPRLGSALVALIDINKAAHASSILRYGGYDTQNAPSYNDTKVQYILDTCIGDADKIDPDVHIPAIAAMSGRRVGYLLTKGLSKNGTYTRTSLHKCLKIPYYNKNLRLTFFLIGDQFRKNCNRGSHYGEIYLDAKAVYIARNESGEYADEAAFNLRDKNYTDRKAIETLKSGKLLPIQIELRSMRKAVSKFVNDLFIAMRLDAFPGQQVERPFPLAYLGHTEYIPPEVPYEDYFEIPEGGIFLPPSTEPYHKRPQVYRG